MIATPSVNVAASEPKRFRVKVHIVVDELTISLPEEIRAELNLQDGDGLDTRIEPGRITLNPASEKASSAGRMIARLDMILKRQSTPSPSLQVQV